MTVPLYTFLFVYGFFLLAFSALSLVNVGHLIKTGTFTFGSFFVTLLFVFFTAGVLFITLNALSQFSWTEPVAIWNAGWIQNPFSSELPTL